MSTVDNHLRICGRCGGTGRMLVANWLRVVGDECFQCHGAGVVCGGYSNPTAEEPPCGSCEADGCPVREETLRRAKLLLDVVESIPPFGEIPRLAAETRADIGLCARLIKEGRPLGPRRKTKGR